MSSLTLVIGRANASRQSPPFPVYVGESGAAANAAMERSAAATFEIFRSVHGLRKNNPRREANAARLIAEAKESFDSANAMAQQLSEITKENVALREKADGQASTIVAAIAEISSLRSDLKLCREARDAEQVELAGARATIADLRAQLAAVPVSPAKKSKA